MPTSSNSTGDGNGPRSPLDAGFRVRAWLSAGVFAMWGLSEFAHWLDPTYVPTELVKSALLAVLSFWLVSFATHKSQ